MSKRILTVIGLSAFLLCVSCRQGQYAVLRDIEQTYNDRDTAGLMRFFADDVALEVENREISKGKTELREIIERLHARGSHLHFKNCRCGGGMISGEVAESNAWLIRTDVGKAVGSFRFGWEDNLFHTLHITLSPGTREGLHRVYAGLKGAKGEKKLPLPHEVSPGDSPVSAPVDLDKWIACIGEWVQSWEESDKRVAKNDFTAVMDLIGAGPGMKIADIGAGEGQYAFLFSRRVGEAGRVYCVEIRKRLLRRIRDHCVRQGTKNVVTVLGKKTDPCLPDAAFDMIFLRHSLHCMRRPGEWLKKARQYFSPRTRLVIIDGDPDILGTGWSYEHTREEVIGMAERAGYILERLETALLPHDYIYVFRPKGVSGGCLSGMGGWYVGPPFLRMRWRSGKNTPHIAIQRL